LAAENNHAVTLIELWVWAEETQNKNMYLKTKMLITINKKERTAWHRASDTGSLEDLQLLLI
jgi:hypothetical protein